MKKYLNFLFVAACAILAVHIVPEVEQLMGLADPAGLSLAVFASFAGLRNIDEQKANPAGIRRIGVIAVKDLLDTVIDWPTAVGADPDVDMTTMEITTALPVAAGKSVAVITPADNSAFMSFENQGDRYYQSYKHSMGFDIAGLTKVQSVELRKYLNTGAIFFTEYNDGEIRVVGSKLSPIVLKSKGDSGKKGGDKRGYALTGDNDNFVIEPPFYPDTLALPGMLTPVIP
ncbi:hypothetical protein [Dyadobacter sp. OTU695]|uniref:hypothetical protein n=1 Tax=Dyadobacter sp. OTU695 TaxID=3043860 RepID=UPI00313AD0B7